jgi:hypothetical protein
LAGLFHRQGDPAAAREALAAGEQRLRQTGSRLELGTLLCIRAEVDHEAGNTEAARAALREAESLAQHLETGPDSELGRLLTKVRGIASSRHPVESSDGP